MSWRVWKIHERKDTKQVLVLLWSSSGQLIVIFKHNQESPQSLEYQIYTDLCALTDDTPTSFFPTKDAIQRAVVHAVESARPYGDEIIQQPLELEKALQIGTENGITNASIIELSDEFTAFCSLLKQPSDLLDRRSSVTPDIVEQRHVHFQEPFKSYRGACTKVSLKDQHEFFVFKGVSFFDYLRLGPSSFQYHLAASYREIQMINTILPKHPNIMPPPKAFVTVNPTTDASAKHLVSGSVYPIYKNGSLAAVLNESREKRTRIPLSRKVKWCSQLASVLYHVHSVARSWHQDLKPPNMLLDDADNILVIDWEKCGANSFILAPEANGEFDVEADTEETEGRRKLRYKAYNGPERVSDPIAVPKWNVFPVWNEKYPEAVELAEIYSLGKTTWLILEQVSTGHGGEDYSSEVVQWSEWSEDIPQSWKDIVDRCIKADPNERTRVGELCRFWEDELKKYG